MTAFSLWTTLASRQPAWKSDCLRDWTYRIIKTLKIRMVVNIDQIFLVSELIDEKVHNGQVLKKLVYQDLDKWDKSEKPRKFKSILVEWSI